MNWKLMILAAVMVVAVMGVFLTQVQDGGSRDADYVFVQTANSGSYADGVLTLDGVSTTLFFSDCPDRVVGHMPNEEFAAQWDDTDDDEEGDSLSAVLSIHDAEEAGAVIALLGPPSIGGQTIRYTIEVAQGSVPPAFGPASLFIDTEEEDLLDDEP